MRATRWRAAGLIGSAFALVLSTGLAPAAAAPYGNRPDITLRVNSAGVAHAPGRTIQPGLIRFDVVGARRQNVQLARAKHGANKADLISDVDTLNNTGNPGPLESDFTFYGGTNTGGSFYATLPVGRYLVVDTNMAKTTAAQIDILTVAGRTSNARLPRLTGVISAVKDMSWSPYPRAIRHAGILEFRNSATDTHFIVLAGLKPGKTVADVNKVLHGMESGRKVFLPGPGFDSGIISPGVTNDLTYSLPKGNYALMCFWPDEDGVPHALKGMVRTIQLT